MARAPARFPVHTGPELRALLRACHEHFDDDTPRLVLADWLEEHDDPRGACVRLQCQLAALPAGAPEYDDLMARHEKWWRAHEGRWAKEGGGVMWGAGPHDRGLPTLGHYDDETFWLNSDDLQDPVRSPRDRLSAAVADGWPGMTWVLPIAFAEFDEFELDVDDDDDAEELVRRAAGEDDPFEPFREPPWAGSPAPVGICFTDVTAVTPEMIAQAATVPNLRGLSLAESMAGPNLLPHLAAVTGLEHLDLGTMRFGDDGVRTLAPLSRLRTLVARGATFTNAGAAELAANFPDLRVLRAGTRRLTAAGYKALAALARLEVLELDRADDAAVRHLAPLSRLRVLNLSGTTATGAGVENFSLLTSLNLEAAPASDAGLSGLASLVRLQHLDLSGTRVTGATLPSLAGLRWLNELYLSQTALRDRDLVHLEGLTRLGVLSLWGTRATKKRLAALGQKLKRTSVV